MKYILNGKIKMFGKNNIIIPHIQVVVYCG